MGISKEMVSDKLKASTVGIAGLGGLGSNVAMALARSGIGRLIIVDFDEVEKSNLNRQAYEMEQVGQRKTEALMYNIEKANPEVDITALCQKLEPGMMSVPFEDVDIVVEALDLAETKVAFIEEIMLKLPNKPIVAASGVSGIGNSEKIGVLKSGNFFLVEDKTAPSSDDGILLAPRVGLFAYWQANIVLEILTEGMDVY
jgi:sulfur carrier protein ThiS adenylyltransferase